MITHHAWTCFGFAPSVGEVFINQNFEHYDTIFTFNNLMMMQLGKSVVAGRDLKKGEILTLDNILVKCAEPHGIRPHLIDQLLGESDSLDVR